MANPAPGHSEELDIDGMEVYLKDPSKKK